MVRRIDVAHPQIQQHILASMQSQGLFSGWQANVPIQKRVALLTQLIDSLILLQKPVELKRAIESAILFERTVFSHSTSKDAYFREYAQKLVEFLD